MKMNQKNISIIILLFIFTNGIGQDINEFYAQIHFAKSLVKIGKTNQAISTYEDAFKRVDYIHTDHLKKVLELVKSNKDKEKIRYYKTKIKQQLKGTNPKLNSRIDYIFTNDQELRNQKYFKATKYYRECFEDAYCNKTSKKYLKSRKLAKIFFNQDSSNIHSLLNLFEQHGYIGEELIGFNSFKVIIILLHFDNDKKNKILYPILEKSLLEGKISPVHFAQILDRHLYSNTGLQKYWTWPCSNKNEKLQFLESDIPQILERRESIGLYDSSLTQINKRRWWILKNQFNK